MNEKSKRLLVFFDVETTGVDISKDRIVSFAATWRNSNGTIGKWKMMCNPGVPISKEASDIHGITDEVAANCAPFSEFAPKIVKLFANADIGGFNSNKFDVPILAEELARCGISFEDKERKYYDAYSVFSKKEPRNLTAAYKRYCGKEIENAHDAMADIAATFEIFEAQIAEYPELADMEVAHEFCEYGNRADFTGNLLYKDGVLVYGTGKFKGDPVLKHGDSIRYAEWMLNADFSRSTKELLRKELARYRNDSNIPFKG